MLCGTSRLPWSGLCPSSESQELPPGSGVLPAGSLGSLPFPFLNQVLKASVKSYWVLTLKPQAERTPVLTAH